MSQNQGTTTDSGSSTEKMDLQSLGDDWASVRDPAERRKIQNKLAQRKYRQKAKEDREERERESVNREHAETAYKPPDPSDLNEYPGQKLSGLPWGGPSMSHIVQAGKMRETASQQSSRETSIHATGSRTGGSSR
ncbi:hypothetical protein K490DRAFT_68996 [Saccharata proteae CBS 121410]|uniref:BZIP domain-containing protein n=1 Tax=Saccharata proteae CBS 121410 TaxID=1314787 RepID=A0A9P4LTV1_9PEZI|nr:hypothetical protein K490DRAFT_68996 [Saccharata proteae CBS 121410]